ncbi:sigma-54-dependent transcriptional regulator [Thermodesulfobacteriota bacterium]
MNDIELQGISKKDFEILFVDDEKDVLSMVEQYLSIQGYSVTVIDDGLKALELVKERHFDVVFTDLNMPEFGGLELLPAIKESRPETEVIVVTGYGSIESAIESMRLGCYDYLQKPIKFELLKILVERILEKRRLHKENILLKSRLRGRDRYGDLVGVSLKMQEIYEIIQKISSESPTVLIEGDSGTGKGLVAKVIHQYSDRSEMPFVQVNCSAIVDGLLESELFGHVKGSFTGAVSDKMGLFKAADGGTIFLDEIAEIPTALQVKLLRALQEKKIRPVGEIKEFGVDVRVIAATNRNLSESLKTGLLRKDLFYRLNVVNIKVPPLKERREDISLLINSFLEKFNEEKKKQVNGFSKEAMDLMLNYSWPGNVRQLENVIERAFALGVGDTIDVEDLPVEIKEANGGIKGDKLELNLRENETMFIKRALKETLGNKAEAAALLGINTATLYRKLKRYNISD